MILAVLVLVPGSLSSRTGDDRLPPIAAALEGNDYATALELLKPRLAKWPNDAELWAMQGAAYAGEHRNPEALAAFSHSLKLSPNYLPALTGAIQIEFDSADPAAIPLLERVLRLRPADETSHGMLAVLEYQQGNCAAALAHFEKAKALFDSQLGALHAYGSCLVKLKRFDRAKAVFEKTLSLNPRDERERLVLASVELMAEEPRDALGTLRSLLESPNPNAGTLELAANAYEDLGETDKAVTTLRQAILADPKDVRLYLDFASLCGAHQSFQAGIDVVNDGIAEEPNSAQLYFARGVLDVQLADYDKAEADIEKAYELEPNQSLTAAAQALLALQQNDLDRALADVEGKLERRPTDPLLLYLEADILARKGAEPDTPEFRKAVRSARRAVALRSSLGPAHAVLAKLYMDSGQNRLAAEQCRKALEIDPKDETSLYRLIQALRKTGNTAEIPDLLKRLAQLRQRDVADEKQRYR
ncbi:MAG: tetratricopeptide repeat protein, partial [Acidobacteria bacterium]|nr:tetratricopeptide repeat protein [Acidobacteriota bacterium]